MGHSNPAEYTDLGAAWGKGPSRRIRVLGIHVVQLHMPLSEWERGSFQVIQDHGDMKRAKQKGVFGHDSSFLIIYYRK